MTKSEPKRQLNELYKEVDMHRTIIHDFVEILNSLDEKKVSVPICMRYLSSKGYTLVSVRV